MLMINGGFYMKIVDVKKTKNKGLINIFFDNDDMIMVDEEDCFKYNLYKDIELTQNEYINIKKNIKYKMAKSIAFKYIVRQLRSIKEVYNKLSFYNFEDSIIDMVIDELKSMGYLNDRIYTHKYIFDRMKNNPKSKKMIEYELKQKGIDRDIIEEAVEEMNVDDLESGIYLARKKINKCNTSEEKTRKKVMSYLRTRGYNMEMIKSILRSLED
jgi:regulatory protein